MVLLLKVLRLLKRLIFRSRLLHSIMADGKKVFKLCIVLKKIIFCLLLIVVHPEPLIVINLKK